MLAACFIRVVAVILTKTRSKLFIMPIWFLRGIFVDYMAKFASAQMTPSVDCLSLFDHFNSISLKTVRGHPLEYLVRSLKKMRDATILPFFSLPPMGRQPHLMNPPNLEMIFCIPRLLQKVSTYIPWYPRISENSSTFLMQNSPIPFCRSFGLTMI